MFVVVLVAVDLAGLAVLLAGDLGTLLRGKFTAVGLTVSADLVIDSRLVSLQVGSLSRGQLTGLDAVGNAVLLVFLALPNGPACYWGVGTGGG